MKETRNVIVQNLINHFKKIILVIFSPPSYVPRPEEGKKDDENEEVEGLPPVERPVPRGQQHCHLPTANLFGWVPAVRLTNEQRQIWKTAIHQEIAAIPPAMTEQVMRAFRNRLEECITNDGHHLGDIIFKT